LVNAFLKESLAAILIFVVLFVKSPDDAAILSSLKPIFYFDPFLSALLAVGRDILRRTRNGSCENREVLTGLFNIAFFDTTSSVLSPNPTEQSYPVQNLICALTVTLQLSNKCDNKKYEKCEEGLRLSP